MASQQPPPPIFTRRARALTDTPVTTQQRTPFPIVAGDLLANNWRVIAAEPIASGPIDGHWSNQRVAVLAYMPGRHQPYATWMALRADDNSTESGHYFADLLNAVTDLYKRAGRDS